jgi:hypothetical protein
LARGTLVIPGRKPKAHEPGISRHGVLRKIPGSLRGFAAHAPE